MIFEWSDISFVHDLWSLTIICSKPMSNAYVVYFLIDWDLSNITL